jgi:hypothetical protein
MQHGWNMAERAKALLVGLTPLQLAIVSAIFVLTLCGAIATALAFRWWNGRGSC